MKNRLLPRVFAGLTTFFLLFLHAVGQTPTAPTQGTANMTLTVLDNQGRGLANTEVEFVETQTRQRVVAKTDGDGKLVQLFTTGRFWQINIKDVREYFQWQFEVPPSKKMNLTKTITYDFKRYERETRPVVDRSKLGLKVEQQKVAVDAAPSSGMGIVKLEIKRADDGALMNFPVSITCYALHKTFSTTTNPAGIATFQVPLNNEYEIDIDGINSYDYVDLPDKPGYRATRRFTYEPTIIKEKVVRDTVEQFLDPAQEGTSGSVITHLTLRGGPGGVWRGEPVFLEVLGEKKWYRGRTDQNGVVTFLLPKGKQYMIHGRYEFDLDVVDLRRRRGIGYSNKSVRYIPQERYQYPERFIPKPEEIVVDAFSKYLEKQFTPPANDKGLNTIAQWGSPVSAGSQEAVLRLAWVPGEEVAKKGGDPLNISLVIDKSGSMAGHDRIDQLKLSLVDFVGGLRETDIVSLVIFEDFETVLIPAQPLGGNKAHMIQLIERIEATGGTNIYKGLEAGYKELNKNFKPNATNRLILLTDGYDGTPIEDFISLQKPYSAKGIDLSAVGVGQDYNVALLKQLATPSGGLIEHVGDAHAMREVFIGQLSSMLYPIAKGVTVEITYDKHLEYKQLMGFPITERTGNRLKIRLKNVYPGLNQIAFIRFKVLQADPSIQGVPVTIKLRYMDLRTNQFVEQVTEAPLQWSDGPSEIAAQFEQQEKKMYAVAVMNACLKGMSDRFHAGDLPGAKAALNDGLASLEKVFPNTADADLRLLKQEMENYLDVLLKQRN